MGALMKVLTAIRWMLIVSALAIASLFVTWRLLAAVDFAYPVLYDVVGIDRTIARYGPENRVRPGFHETTRGERERVFAAIAEAVRQNGEGLDALTYRAADGRALGALLTEAEIVHLNDVARLVTRFEQAGWLSLAVLAALLLSARLRGEHPPRGRGLALGAAIGLGILLAALFIIGPESVFYWLHVQVFPAGHQWFFYYQESLMSMMMRAPVLFGAIAAIWLPLAVCATVLGFLLIRRLLGVAPG